MWPDTRYEHLMIPVKCCPSVSSIAKSLSLDATHAPMSALGHKRTFQGFRAMSALPSKADLKADIFEVCRCPLSAKRSSFDALALSAISSEAT